jgi:hypothetical protein
MPTTFVPSGSFQPKEHRQDERVDRPHTHNDGRMAHRRVAQAHREAHLVDDHAEKSQVEERPEVAAPKPFQPRTPRIRKSRQS